MKIETILEQLNRIFLDSAPIIYYVESNPNYFLIIDEVFNYIESHSIAVITSPITLAECLILPTRQKNLSGQQQFINILTSQDTINFVDINSEIALIAADIRVRYNLKLPDALQIATAIHSNCDAFLTNDLQLKKVSELSILVISELTL
ncbi:twitching motility protein PilT [Hydrocoleum sp. CS-953]|uniref:type II toxin-antitoxin system VapC family toxin n=1 Tax=Hydrocoleum sp. CS-953 TaxID=1671698 RepID=UPI000B9ABC3B|nr:PIN domain-containing protein [Hydrocoleum sp. CS-953]OZH55375.1 twitching motility protein PilT [Hydrocoleum sp. CS-953]